MTTTTRGSPVGATPSPAAVATVIRVSSGSRARRIGWLTAAAFVIVAGTLVVLRSRSGNGIPDTLVVVPRDFTIALHEKGELKAAKSIDVKCEVEGRSNVTWLIPEGTEVAAGDLLVRLASQEIDDRVKTEEIKETNSKAAAEAAANEYEMTLDTQASLVRKAELALQTAEIEFNKYTEGDWKQEQTDAELAVQRAAENFRQRQAELQDARELYEEYKFTLDPAQRDDLRSAALTPGLREAFAARDIVLGEEAQVAPDPEQSDAWLIAEGERRYSVQFVDDQLKVFYRRNFITKLELQQASFALLEADIEREKAGLRQDILHKYTHPKDLRQKTSDVEEAQKELERTRKSATAKIAQSLADKEAKAAEYEFTRQQLERLRRQQAHCQIQAPAAGMVVYDTGSGHDRRQIAEGAEVFERQTIVKLPDTSVMQVLVRIHESKANKVQLGQRARVEVEGLPGVVLEGEITKIAPLADSQDNRHNPELREYQTEITLAQNAHNLKPGVTARVEIRVDEVRNALAVPVPAVVTKQGRRYVFRGHGRAFEPVEVELGHTNDEYVEILKGLAQGDRVQLAVSHDAWTRIPELPAATPEPASRDKVAEAPPTPPPPGNASAGQ